jgi:hypothetical protein
MSQEVVGNRRSGTALRQGCTKRTLMRPPLMTAVTQAGTAGALWKRGGNGRGKLTSRASRVVLGDVESIVKENGR